MTGVNLLWITVVIMAVVMLDTAEDVNKRLSKAETRINRLQYQYDMVIPPCYQGRCDWCHFNEQ